ncbi:Transcription repressor OFP7 [Euphorbia peplus]|nr:Transcription repressor OFP7 [Euphorbia peplus]
MSKHNFKLKLSRAVPNFQICRSKILSETQSPIPSTYKLSRFHPKQKDITFPNPNLPDPPPSTPTSRRKPQPRHSRSLAHFLADLSIESSDFSGNKWPGKQYIQSLSFSDDSFESFCSVAEKHNENETGVTVTVTQQEPDNSEFSFSCEADDEDEEEEELETSLLFSSRSFSYDSSHDFTYPANKNDSILDERSNRKTRFRTLKPYQKTKTEVDSPMRSSVLRRMISCTMDHGKVKESVAVVKKSEDPYEDFRRSMLEMILEKQMFEGKDLEELLQCFLRLNSSKYHEVIVKAFSEIWEILFCDSPVKNTNSKTLYS